ncbi:superkiller viralicidic activity 2-like protein [Trifolium pratense]|uniref:Superkiller viralicidic activity 2-like protein n=1 Tax=Trifolium pratense TaxID=57577 RepID=A0A2K3NCH8_TRIPR|nr:superkiller viralicidic activity 2-like protein [Trifolium pratense]
MRSEDGDPENLLRNSFFQFQADRAIPDLEKQIKAFEEERESIVIEEEDSLKDYYNLLEQLRSLNKEVRDIVLLPKHCLPFLQPGRLVSIQCTSSDEDISPIFIEDQLTWGLIINFERIKGVSEDDASIKPEDASYKVDILTRCVVRKDKLGKKSVEIVPLKEHGEPIVVSIPISQIGNRPTVFLFPKSKFLSPRCRRRCRWCDEGAWLSASPLSGSITAVIVLGFPRFVTFGLDLVQPAPPPTGGCRSVLFHFVLAVLVSSAPPVHPSGLSLTLFFSGSRCRSNSINPPSSSPSYACRRSFGSRWFVVVQFLLVGCCGGVLQACRFACTGRFGVDEVGGGDAILPLFIPYLVADGMGADSVSVFLVLGFCNIGLYGLEEPCVFCVLCRRWLLRESIRVGGRFIRRYLPQ